MNEKIDPQMTVEEARELLDGLDPRVSFAEHAQRLRARAERCAGTISSDYSSHANLIEVALRTLQASDAPSTTEADR